MERFPLTTLVVIAALLPATARSASTADPVAATHRFRIVRDLPTYRFHLVPDPPGPERDGERQVGRIEVSRGSSASVVQVIAVKTYADGSWFPSSFTAEDVDFDGDLDIGVLYAHGAKWGSRRYWLFDRATGRFVSNSLTRELQKLGGNEVHLDATSQEIRVVSLSPDCPDDTRVYRVVDDSLMLMRQVEHQRKQDSCRATTRERRDGGMKLVSRRTRPLRF